MRFLYSVLIVLFCNLSFSQNYFVNKDFTKDESTNAILVAIDWNKDFFIEAELSAMNCDRGESTVAGIMLGKNKEKKTNYMFAINYFYSEEKYSDNFMIKGENLENLKSNGIWQESSLINNNNFNRLQVYKIADEIFFAINDQVVYHIQSIETKGDDISWVSSNHGLRTNYIKGYYLENENRKELRATLLQQLKIYEETGIHYKISPYYPKVLNLIEPDYDKILKQGFYHSIYNPETQTIEIRRHLSTPLLYDSKSGIEISEEAYSKRIKKPLFFNLREGFSIEIPGQPKELLTEYTFMDVLDNSTVLMKKKNSVYTYDFKTKKITKLFKSENVYIMRVFITKDKKYMSCQNQVFDLKTGQEIKYSRKDKLRDNKILAIFDNSIIVENNNSYSYIEINFLTNEEIVINESIYSYTFDGKYKYIYKGKELAIYDMSAKKFVVQNLQLLIKPKDTSIEFEYHPELNEVYISQTGAVTGLSYFYFSNNDKVKNTTDYIVNTFTNGITPLLFYKSNERRKDESNAYKTKTLQNDIDVDTFIAPFKTFGSYYELDYDNLDYINLTGSEFLKKI